MNKKEKLEEIHDEVKNHLFRTSGDREHVEDYLEKLSTLMDRFFDAVEETSQYSKIKWVMYSFSHDFKSCMLQVSGDKEDSKDIQHIEQCISSIHKFLEHDKVVELWTYYTGVNKYDSSSRMRQFLWHEEKEEMIPQYEKEELENVIEEIKEKRKEYDGDTSDLITSMYDKERLEFYNKLLITSNYRMHKMPKYQY